MKRVERQMTTVEAQPVPVSPRQALDGVLRDLGTHVNDAGGPVSPTGGDPFGSVKDLIAAIGRFIDGWNDRCPPFVGTKTAAVIGAGVIEIAWTALMRAHGDGTM
jgi:hypothetical protein